MAFNAIRMAVDAFRNYRKGQNALAKEQGFLSGYKGPVGNALNMPSMSEMLDYRGPAGNALKMPSLRSMPEHMANNALNRGSAIMSDGDLTMDMNPKSAFGTPEGRIFQAPIIDPALAQIDVYHGSPHKFDKFKMSKIGTGEGAQAFGHGLYFTSKESIAKTYSRALATGDYIVEGRKLSGNEAWAAQFIKNENGDIKAAKNRVNEIIGGKTPKAEQARKDVRNYIDQLSDKRIEQDEGSIYKATLHTGKTPDQYDYLEWDKPRSIALLNKIKLQAAKDWSDELQDVFNLRLKNDDIANKGKGFNGENIYRAISNTLGSDREASLFLLRAGIDGIRYPAGTLSGIKDSKDYNYVVFSDESISIEGIE